MKKLTTAERGDFVVLSISGSLIGGPDATVMHKALTKNIRNGKHKFILELSDCKWMNSIGFGILITSLTTVKRNKGELVFCGLTEEIKSLFTITNLINILAIYDDVEAAMSSFSKDEVS